MLNRVSLENEQVNAQDVGQDEVNPQVGHESQANLPIVEEARMLDAEHWRVPAEK